MRSNAYKIEIEVFCRIREVEKMQNFIYDIPTRVYFGKGQIGELGTALREYGNRILMVYGGGSIKRNGLYEDIKEVLEEDFKVWELPGVKPNPRIESVRRGVEICRENAVEAILALGGGSSIDCAKAIAAAFYYKGDAWEMVKGKGEIKKALPVAAVLTLAATGSEMDRIAVISNMETREKLAVNALCMAPKFSILDPSYTFSVSGKQTASGIADIMSHILENYFNREKGAYLQDRMAEALLKTCIRYGKTALEEPDNYEARANLMWSSSLAINGLLSYGKCKKWSVHPMEHELSAFFDVTHGVGLAILTPHWMEYVLDETSEDKFSEYGENVWEITPSTEKRKTAAEAIEKTAQFFSLLEIPSRLRDVGVERNSLRKMAAQAARFGPVGNFRPLYEQDVLKIYEKAY